MEYGKILFKMGDPGTIIGALIFILLIFYAAGKRSKDKLISFAIFWFFLALAPVSNIFPINAFMALYFMNITAKGIYLNKRDIFVEETVEKDGILAKTTRRCLYFIKEKKHVKNPDELKNIAEVKIEPKKAIICVVGAGVKRRSGVVSLIFTPLAREKINVEMVCVRQLTQRQLQAVLLTVSQQLLEEQLLQVVEVVVEADLLQKIWKK